jgi:hypothetical protein
MTTLEHMITRGRLRLFMSYARVDAQAVRQVEEGITSLHHEIWVDRKLSGGQDWWDEILSRIRACDAMVVAVSPALLESDAAAKERVYARQLGKPLLPVLVAHLPTDLLPPDLASLQLIDYTDLGPATGFQFAGALAILPPAPPLPEPLPAAPLVPVSYLAGRADQVYAPMLSLEEQLSLVAILRVSLQRPREHDAALELLRALTRRRDLYYATWQELAELLGRQQGGGDPGARPLSMDGVAGPEAFGGAAATELVTTPPGWYPDPSGRHQLRWFDADWTRYAADAGTPVDDPDF